MITVVGRGAVGRSLAAAFGVRPVSKVPRHSDDLVFLCWPEAVLLERAAALPSLRYVLVSGSLDPKLLRAAVFHPLYGFTREQRTAMSGVPVGLQASRRVSLAELTKLARSVKARPFRLPKNRTLYHAAAVTAGAGVLAAFEAAAQMLRAAGLTDAEAILKPIALQALSTRRLTGPVVRHDDKTIRAHGRALRALGLLPIYKALIAQMRRL